MAMEEGAEMSNGDNAHDINSLLSSPGRDFLVRNNGDQVDSLSGKNIGLYFSCPGLEGCRDFNSDLVDLYTEFCPQGILEVIFVPSDEYENSCNGCFTEMPWLAIPINDSETCDRLLELFNGWAIPSLVRLDGNGKVVSRSGANIFCVYGMEACPFTLERIMEVKEAKKAESLTAKFLSQSRDFLISNDGTKKEFDNQVKRGFPIWESW